VLSATELRLALPLAVLATGPPKRLSRVGSARTWPGTVPGGSYGMLALLRRRPPPDWGLPKPPACQAPAAACHSAILIMMPQRAAEAPTLGCRTSRGCQVQEEHAATKHAVTPHVYCK
jgi:hypothetical protein